MFDEHVRAPLRDAPTSPTTSAPSGSSTRSARCCPRSPRSWRTTSAACCSRSRRSTSRRSATPPSSRPRRAEPGWGAVMGTPRARHRRRAARRATRSARAVEGMFDRARAALRPHEPRHLARAATGAGAAAPSIALGSRPEHASSTSRAAPATSAATSPRAGYAPVGVDFSAGMLARGDCVARRWCGATAPCLPFADRVVRRRRLRVRAAQLRRPRRRCSPSPRACCARGGRFAALDAAVPDEPGPAGRERGLVPRRGPAPRARPRPRRRRVPLPPEVHRVPARADELARIARRGRLQRRRQRARSPAARSCSSRGRAHDRRTPRDAPSSRARHPRGRRSATTSLERPRLPTGSPGSTTGPRFVTAGVAAVVAPADADGRASRRSTPTTRSRRPAPARSRSARCRSTPPRPATWSSRSGSSARRRPALDHRDRAVGARRSRPAAAPRAIHRRGARRTHDEWCDDRRAARSTIDRARRPREGRARPRGDRRGRRAVRPRDVSCGGLRDAAAGLLRLRVEGLVGASPELLVRRTRR